MDVQQNLQIAERLLEAHVSALSQAGPGRLDAEIEADSLLSATRMLVNTEWGYLAAITSLAADTDGGQPEVVYLFCAGEAIVTLRLLLRAGQASIPSVSRIVPFAAYFEQELSQTLGIGFETPCHTPPFSSEKGADVFFPLLKPGKS